MAKRTICVLAVVWAFALLGSVVWGDHLVLQDGTVLSGTVIKQGDSYWIKMKDGTSRTVPASKVKTHGRGDAPAGTAGKGQAAGGEGSSPAFLATKSRAGSVETPMAAVAMWQKFIEDNPESPDLPAAKQEMARWQALAESGAEKINGKWVGGEERKAIVEKAEKLAREGWELLLKDQTLAAVKKLEEAARIYPNSFHTNFVLGYLSMLQDKEDVAIRYFEQALRQRPDSPSALANLGIAHCIKRQHERGINLLFKAAESADTPEIAQNLVNAISYAPNALRTSPRMRKTVDAAQLLAAKYGIRGPTNGFRLVQLTQKELEQAAGPDAAAMPGMLSSGTGFLINDEGLILTNRHVVEDGKTFMVVLNGGEQRAAEVVVIDEQQDLALVRIKPEDGEKLPYVQLSPNDRPGDGAECTVMGYPLIDRLGASIKITRGIVSSSSEFDVADVLIDAKVNPGNSGGPILDQHGNVMAIVCMKTLSNSMEDTYGIGISAGRIRTFLAKNNVKVTPGNPSPSPLNAEQIATRVKPATVCIIATR